MKHVIENFDLCTTLVIDETLCENTSIAIETEKDGELIHYLTPKDLKNLIGVLLHIQAKKRKIKGFDELSNSF